MKIRTRQVTLIGIAALTLGYGALVMSQGKPTHKSKANPDHPSGAFNPQSVKRLAGTQNFTLQRVRDYHYAGGNVDCPHCKDMYCSLLRPPAMGAVITDIQTTAQQPVANNHWYRCQVAANCGRPE